MKLFTRYSRLNFAAMLVVFIIGASSLFFTFRYILIQQVDESLDIERDENIQYIHQFHRLPPIVNISDQKISYHEIAVPEKPFYKTERQQGDDGMEDFRALSFPLNFEGRYYQFDISTPLEHTQHLLRAMAIIALISIGIMFISIYIVNRRLVQRLLKPFYQTIDTVRKYSISHQLPLELPATPIQEFTALNYTLNDLSARGRKDYQLLRDFTAHAAHEMQTPLAVIRTKLEALMQHQDIGEQQAQQIGSIDDTVERLSRLFKSLLLLTKIENQQFSLTEPLNLEKIVEDKVKEVEDVISVKNLSISQELEPAILSCNRHLAEILVGNLVNNAIRYNYAGGAINIRLQQGRLTISNTSAIPQLDADSIYRPFYRHANSTQEGNGLGLSIVKQICEACNMVVEYSFHNAVHEFRVIW